MKGDKGTCTAGELTEPIRRTKFNTKENCENYTNSLIALNILPQDTVIYKCKVCECWHSGKPEWAKLYSIK